MLECEEGRLGRSIEFKGGTVVGVANVEWVGRGPVTVNGQLR